MVGSLPDVAGIRKVESRAAQVPPLPARLVDPIPLVLVGTALWLIGFVVLLIHDLMSGLPPQGWTWVCLAGVGLGGIGLSIFQWQRFARRHGSRGAQDV